jgi:hypothetical protein
MNERFGTLSRGADCSRGRSDEDVVEVPLLLLGWQVSALERAAHDRGLTAGEMVRTLIRDFVSAETPAAGRNRN